jgi:hypothetical protein
MQSIGKIERGNRFLKDSTNNQLKCLSMLRLKKWAFKTILLKLWQLSDYFEGLWQNSRITLLSLGAYVYFIWVVSVFGWDLRA